MMMDYQQFKDTLKGGTREFEDTFPAEHFDEFEAHLAGEETFAEDALVYDVQTVFRAVADLLSAEAKLCRDTDNVRYVRCATSAGIVRAVANDLMDMLENEGHPRRPEEYQASCFAVHATRL